MGDRIKELRDKNPILDFAAGFIPFVGEAQDAHDFYHAAKKGDFGGMALASLGFVIPGVTGNWIKHGANFVSDAVRNSRRYSSSVPVYNKQTAPKTLKLSDKDITEMHLNDGSAQAEQLFGKELITSLNKRFADADHGTAVRIGNSLDEADYGLSSASAPLFYKMSRRWAGQGKGGYFVPEGEEAIVRMNKVAQMTDDVAHKHPPFSQELVDQLNKEIQEINKLGHNFKPAELVKRKNPYQPGTVLHKQFERNTNNTYMTIPNIGFLKYKNGGKYVY